MGRLAIRLLPDPVLRTVAAPVAAFDDRLRLLAGDMLETMYAAPGRGLAAPQVGVPLRLFVMDATWKDGRRAARVLVNPEITWRSATTRTGEEGCLSIPGRTCVVERAAAVRVAFRALDGSRLIEEFEGIAAVIVQHEADHLDGILCTDRALPTAA